MRLIITECKEFRLAWIEPGLTGIGLTAHREVRAFQPPQAIALEAGGVGGPERWDGRKRLVGGRVQAIGIVGGALQVEITGGVVFKGSFQSHQPRVALRHLEDLEARDWVGLRCRQGEDEILKEVGGLGS